MATLCGDDQIGALISESELPADERIHQLEGLLTTYPEDARLHLLLGAAFVGDGRLIEGHRSLSRAVALRPDLAIARFQLGLLQLTSGESTAALETFGGLDLLPDTHYLRHFVDGLRSLVRDQFGQAVEKLRAGIALNQENEPLNRDMQLIIERCESLLGKASAAAEGEAVSETSLLLHRLTGRKR